MNTQGSNAFKVTICAALLLASGLIGTAMPNKAEAQPASPFLYCFVSPNSQPGGPLGLCSSQYPSASYSASFSVQSLPAGTYSFVWTNEIGQVLPCTRSSCTVNYLGGMAINDVIYVNYTNTTTGASNTLSRAVAINGPF
ncbi:hypothetical protein [Luteimonas suaedae]|uniref:hypothetical protein n=1 Tax=Luteimonas suaedae TaxID=2605430 RepID=UPI0011EE07C3|nr:hypothetical protein [Luteimonas suaedae]